MTTKILEEIRLLPSSVETIDFALYDFINDRLYLYTDTNKGWEKTPVMWLTSERTFQIKEDKNMRDFEGALNLPMVLIERTSMSKDPSKKGTYQANLPFFDRIKGGQRVIAKRIQQKKTSEFANADANIKHNNITKPNFVRKKTSKIVYNTYSSPQPVYIYTTYSITLKTQYQQQMNELLQPFMTRTGNINYFKITKDGHFYEAMIQADFSLNNNSANMSEEERKYETKIDINVIGYLMGENKNDQRPRVAVIENAVDIKMPRERVLVGDTPDHFDIDLEKQGINGDYRE